MDDPSPTGGVSGGDSSLGLDDPSGGLSDPYPYPTDSESLGVPQATPTGAGSGAGPVESGGVSSGSGSGGHVGGAGGYSPVPKPAGLEFPVEACYPACTPLANDAEVSFATRSASLASEGTRADTSRPATITRSTWTLTRAAFAMLPSRPTL